MMPRRTAEEAWKALESQEIDDEMERVLAMTPEARRGELRAAGFDLDVEDARLDAWRQAARAGARTSGIRVPPRRSTVVAWLVAAAITVLLAAATIPTIIARNTPAPVPSAMPPQIPAARGTDSPTPPSTALPQSSAPVTRSVPAPHRDPDTKTPRP